jgi:hypothetical protein
MRKHHVVEKEEDYASEWKTKSVVWPDKNGYVLKYFKDDIKDYLYSYDEQLDILALKKRYFWKYIPETVLVREDWDKYYIKQKFIKWKLLKFVDVEDLPPKTLDALFDLFKNYITFSRDEWVVMDVYWYQRDLEGLDNIWARRFAVYMRFYTNFLNSSNVIVSDDWDVYMVDVCDIKPMPRDVNSWHFQNLKKFIRNRILSSWIKRTLSKLKSLSEAKKKELLENLEWNSWKK